MSQTFSFPRTDSRSEGRVQPELGSARGFLPVASVSVKLGLSVPSTGTGAKPVRRHTVTGPATLRADPRRADPRPATRRQGVGLRLTHHPETDQFHQRCRLKLPVVSSASLRTHTHFLSLCLFTLQRSFQCCPVYCLKASLDAVKTNSSRTGPACFEDCRLQPVKVLADASQTKFRCFHFVWNVLWSRCRLW